MQANKTTNLCITLKKKLLITMTIILLTIIMVTIIAKYMITIVMIMILTIIIAITNSWIEQCETWALLKAQPKAIVDHLCLRRSLKRPSKKKSTASEIRACIYKSVVFGINIMIVRESFAWSVFSPMHDTKSETGSCLLLK